MGLVLSVLARVEVQRRDEQQGGDGSGEEREQEHEKASLQGPFPILTSGYSSGF